MLDYQTLIFDICLQIREKMKKNGINPMANSPPPTYISSFGVVLDKYVPPEGDGKVSDMTEILWTSTHVLCSF